MKVFLSDQSVVSVEEEVRKEEVRLSSGRDEEK